MNGISGCSARKIVSSVWISVWRAARFWRAGVIARVIGVAIVAGVAVGPEFGDPFFDDLQRRAEFIAQVFNAFGTTNLLPPGAGSYVDNTLSDSFGKILSAQPRQQGEVAIRFSF